jgi:hypothetical protein
MIWNPGIWESGKPGIQEFGILDSEVQDSRFSGFQASRIPIFYRNENLAPKNTRLP